ncbi:MAG: B12-binding domain-containing radical SAM protein [Alphaproteobacteria bacterium]
MKRLRITIIDLVSNKPARRLYARIMNPNFASIMPQAVGVWCEELGHDVRFICYTGFEDFSQELLNDTDVLFVSAFTLSAQFAYAISNLYRRQGAVTVLGGPHARCYPEDAARYFDYVLGLTDKSVVDDVLRDGTPHRPVGRQLGSMKQPAYLPGVRERWKFIEPTIAKAPLFKLIPMIGSTGCPYTCSFCIDSVVNYQTLGFDQIREDLDFLLGKLKRPHVAWHDPNFGVRFDDYLSTIEEAVPSGRIDFVAESSLSLLSEPHLQRLRKNGFKAILPGIESWYSLGNKSKTGNHTGMEKVLQVSDHVKTILRYIPYVQTNFVLGLDCDEGSEPFELTKRFLDLTPGAYPAFSLFTAYGRAAPLNLDLQRDGRVLPLPFHLLNSTRAMNIRPRNYDWPKFFRHVEDLTSYAHSRRQIYRRFRATSGFIPKWFGALRAGTSKKTKYYGQVHDLLMGDRPFRAFFEGGSSRLPEFFENIIRNELGRFWEALPSGALHHDPYAYLKSSLDKYDDGTGRRHRDTPSRIHYGRQHRKTEDIAPLPAT